MSKDNMKRTYEKRKRREARLLYDAMCKVRGQYKEKDLTGDEVVAAIRALPEGAEICEILDYLSEEDWAKFQNMVVELKTAQSN